MKRLFRMFELTTNEQRVVLIVMLALIAISVVGYERRIHHSTVQQTPATMAQSSPTPAEIEEERYR